MEDLRFPLVQTVIQNRVQSGKGMFSTSMQIDALKKSFGNTVAHQTLESQKVQK